MRQARGSKFLFKKMEIAVEVEKSHTYDGVVVYPAPPKAESKFHSHFFITMI